MSAPIRGAAVIAAGDHIAAVPPGGADMAFSHALLCQVGLPRKKVEEREFLRRCGKAWVYLQAGNLDLGRGPVPQPVPYGVQPRLALSWISTYAARHKTREIPIGRSPTDFLRLMGVAADSGKRYERLKMQMQALAACRLQLGFNGCTYSGEVVRQCDAWGRGAKWTGQLTLSKDYYDEIVAHGVPLDNRALQALQGSALALDLYSWLAYRLHRISGRPLQLKWGHLKQQFGQEYQGKNSTKDFRNEFIDKLTSVLAVYRQADVTVEEGGLRLSASPPPIGATRRALAGHAISATDDDLSVAPGPETRKSSDTDAKVLHELDAARPSPAERAESAMEFQRLRDEYPQFAALADWSAAEKCACGLVSRDEATWEELYAGVMRYAAFVAAGGVSGPRYVLSPTKFFGDENTQPWRQAWTLPAGPHSDERPADPAVERVFDHWRRTYRRPRAVLDAKRIKVIAAALEMYSEADLCQAIDGYRYSPLHMGDNQAVTVYDDIELFLRDAKHIEFGQREWEMAKRV